MSKRVHDVAGIHYSGPAIISDGQAESSHNVKIHARVGQNANTTAWHVVIEDKLPRELRSPFGKTLSVRIADGGGQGVGTLIDARLIRGVGEPPPQ